MKVLRIEPATLAAASMRAKISIGQLREGEATGFDLVILTAAAIEAQAATDPGLRRRVTAARRAARAAAPRLTR